MAATDPARQTERRRDWQQPATAPRTRGELVVADGYGVQLRVQRRQLVVEDGIGRSRRRRVFSRSDRLMRLVVLGGSGSLSLEALRWLADVGAALVCIDRDARLLCTSTPTKSDAKLRRAQALAAGSSTGLRLAQTLFRSKLQGQQAMLDRLQADGYARRVFAASIGRLEAAESPQGLMAIEAEAAFSYWQSWAGLPVRFRPGEQRALPAHWLTFGQRSSPLTASPRLAITPAGAILNYLYALLETEARLACLTLGLDPALGVLHADVRGRDSLPLDLMEAVRPNVDRYMHALLTDRVFHASDFHENRRGSCRVLSPLTHELAETLPAWRRLIAPVAEQACKLLAEQESPRRSVPTPLTETNRRADRARRNSRAAPVSARMPKPERRCKRCGGPLPHRERGYCDDCLPHYQADRYQAFVAARQAKTRQLRNEGVDPSHGGDAARKRGASVRRHQHEARRWNEANERPEASLFEREILPLIRDLSLAELVRATGLTHGYLSQVRRGVKTPHPRHWPALRQAASPVVEQHCTHISRADRRSM
jgi:CRISPR-associated endonuclease Cas1